ncbi:tyrosine--tRNA ligase [Mycoplasmoides pirum]|uniref:tyrosine--tRNA ligase n=1 Tax=Mycoplasmoides pirum TaxID=2122 RepID=UPI000481CC29|nr:tyrosine--tRNA ligase [Mycoplasmoides pirum]
MNKKHILDFLEERGLIAQTVFYEELKELLSKEKINFYIGFDPTADSLHVGHLLMLRVAKLLQEYGHKPFLILGGGTGHIGDPSGRTDMRQMLDTDNINEYVNKFKNQIEKFLNFDSENKAIFLNNASWLLELKWVEILREVGQHISVNKMLSTDAYKNRWENGLSFLELNYMVMQGYDFLYLNRNHNVVLQLGGSDQWSNILSGIDLIRRLEKKTAYGLTLTLLTNSDGKKMGKTSNGALWLNPNKTSPYDFYQYWINVDDRDLEKLFLLLTNLDKKEIEFLINKKGKEIIESKHRLAYLITELVHGNDAAEDAKKKSLAAFIDNDVNNMPEISIKLLDKSIASLLVDIKFCTSKSEAKRLINSKAIYINETIIQNPLELLHDEWINNKFFIVHKGKKQHIKVILKD